MNVKTWIPLAVALVLGVVAAKLARDMIAQQPGSSGPAPAMMSVVVAAKDVAPGKPIQPSDVTLGQIPSKGAPDAVPTSVDQVVGRIVRTELVKGQVVLETLLAPVGAAAGLQALVPEGMRAIALQVDPVTGLSGLLAPGCRVDVIFTIRADDKHEPAAVTIVQNVPVTAVGQRTSASAAETEGENGQPAQPANTVTLLVTPEQAETIELAGTFGRPRLVLRGNGDSQPIRSPGVTINSLRGGSNEPAPTAGSTSGDPFQIDPARATSAKVVEPFSRGGQNSGGRHQRTVTVIKGTQETQVTFEVSRPDAALTGSDSSAIFPK